MTANRRRHLQLHRLEDRSVPAAFQIGSTSFETAVAVAADQAGNLYVSGEFDGTVDFDPGPGVTTLTSGGAPTKDYYLAKYTAAGELVWVGHLPDAAADALAVDATGAVYVTGWFRGTLDLDLGAGSSTLTTGAEQAVYVAKYNPDGGLAWARRLGGQSSGLSGNAVAVDAAGNVFAGGYFSNGSADFDPGAGTTTFTNSSGNQNGYVVKLDPAGDFVWARQFANDPSIAATVVVAALGTDAAGNVYAAGGFSGRADFDPAPGNQWVEGIGPGGDGFVVRLTTAGDLGYVVRFGSASVKALAADPAGNVFAAGLFTNTATIDATAGDTTLTSAGSFDAYVLKLDPAGGLTWARRYGSTSFDSAWGLGRDGAGGLYLTGYYAGTVDFDPGPGAFNLTYGGGAYDAYALRLGPDGSFVEAGGLGGTGTEIGLGVAATSTGEFAVVGRFSGAGDYDPGPGVLNFTSAGADDAFIAILTAAPVNLPPTAAAGTLTTDEDTATTGTLSATDPENDPLTFSLVNAAAAHGTVTITNATTGAYSYTPDPDYHGPASFTFKATAAGADSNVATVSITVNPRNDAPTAADGIGSTAEDTPLDGNLPATDVDGDALTYTVTAGPTHGTLTAFDSATGAFTYTPAANYNGTDAVAFQASDGTASSNTATFALTVTPVNDPPTALDDSATVAPNAGPTAVAVLGNDSFAPDAGETLTITAVTQPANGTVAITGGGTGLTYQPAAGYAGPDTFTYTIADGNGGSATASVAVRVAANSPPTAVVDTATVPEDAGPTTIPVLANDSTAPDTGETLTIQSVTAPAGGTAAVAPDGKSILYTPAPDFAGMDTFYYVVNDGNGGLASTAVIVTVTNDGTDRLEVVPSPVALDFREKRDTSLPLDAGLTVGTAEKDLVTKAVLRFAAGYVKGRDQLAFAPQGGLKGRFSPGTGTLTITGKAPPDVYEAALRTVQYVNRSADPIGGPRSVSITLFDAAGPGEPAIRAIHVTAVNDAPTVALPPTTVVAKIGKPAAVLSGIKLGDPDTAFLRAATVRIANVQTGDGLRINGLTSGAAFGITFAYSNGALTLTGTASPATYLRVLKLVKFTGTVAGLRALEVTADDGLLASDPATRSVAVG